MRKDMEMERPIGYWLKHLDRLIEAAAERTFAEEKLTRRHWQIMNVLRQSPQDAADLTEAIRPFWGPGAITLDEVTSELAHRGWLTQDDTGRYALTPAGQAGHAAVGKKVQGIRSTSLTGLSEEDYNGTVQVLQRMAENLERATGQGAAPHRPAKDLDPQVLNAVWARWLRSLAIGLGRGTDNASVHRQRVNRHSQLRPATPRPTPAGGHCRRPVMPSCFVVRRAIRRRPVMKGGRAARPG